MSLMTIIISTNIMIAHGTPKANPCANEISMPRFVLIHPIRKFGKNFAIGVLMLSTPLPQRVPHIMIL
jgi:hypothetical protein